MLPLAACNSDGGYSVINSVQATASTAGTVNAVAGGSQNLSVTFISNDGQAASALSVGGLGALPTGWSGPGTFGCATVTSGSGCVLNLTYAPTGAGSGTLTLTYSYTNNTGLAMSNTLTVPYAATAHDNVAAISSPTGQVDAVLSGGSVPVTVTFTTDDGQTAGGLTLTSSLGSLPAGWSSADNSFSCATVSVGTSCQLLLSYAPQAVATGTLTLTYSYVDDTGSAKSGSISIPYAATTNDNVVGTTSPSGQVDATVGDAGATVTVSFATDDGNPATNLAVSSGLASLPSGWSGPASFSCATVSNGATCQLALTYAPSSTGSSTLSLTYGYDNDAGDARTGTVNISYGGIAPHLYVTSFEGSRSVFECTVATAGALSNCTAALSPLGGSFMPTGIAFYGNTAYLADYSENALDVCAVNSDGSLSNCDVLTGFLGAWALAVSGNYLYVAPSNTMANVMYCQIGGDGSLSNCAAAGSWNNLLVTGIAVGGGYAYIAGFDLSDYESVMYVCVQDTDGTLSSCTTTGSGFSSPQFITLTAGYAYIGNQGADAVAVCTIGTGGALTNCNNSSIPGSYEPNGVALFGGYAYVGANNDNLYVCVVNSSDGSLSSCVVSNGGATYGAPQQLAFH